MRPTTVLAEISTNLRRPRGDPKRRLFTFALSETLRAPLPKPLAVVKWYRINAYWYKPDPPGLGEW